MEYGRLNETLRAMIEGLTEEISGLANAAALLYISMEEINWAGFYLMRNGRLILGPFQGKPACVEILPGRGVCGTAVQRDETQTVRDVHEFPGHIACDGASRSEIVVPLHRGGEVYGVLDIDSPTVGRFKEEDRAGLEGLARILEEWLKTTAQEG